MSNVLRNEKKHMGLYYKWKTLVPITFIFLNVSSVQNSDLSKSACKVIYPRYKITGSRLSNFLPSVVLRKSEIFNAV